MDSTTLAKAVKLNKELEEINKDITAIEDRGQNRTMICYAHESESRDEDDLGQGRKFFNHSIAKTAVLNAFRVKKEDIETQIAAL